VIPEVSPPTPECPHPEQWRCYDGMATEVEVLEFLAALVSVTKAKTAVETGCYHGYGSTFIGRAVRANGGTLHTCDIDTECVRRTLLRLSQQDLARECYVHHKSGVDLIKGLRGPIDFAFLDSEFKGERARELAVLLPKLAPSGVVAVHDTSRRHVENGGPRMEMLDAAREQGLELITLDTPRGLILLRKPL